MDGEVAEHGMTEPRPGRDGRALLLDIGGVPTWCS
jgi:hypothetical protein